MNSTKLDSIKSRSSEILIQFTNGHVDSRLRGTNQIQQNFNDCLRLHYLYGIVDEARLDGSDIYIGNKQLSEADLAEVYHKIWHYNGIFADVDLTVYDDITPDSGDGSSCSGSTTSSEDHYRAGAIAVTAGSATVTFSSPLASTDYRVDVRVRSSSGFEQRNLGAITKYTNGFTVNDIVDAGTLTYFAVIDL